MSGYYDRLVAAARNVAEYRDPDARLIHVPADVLDALIAALDQLPLDRDLERRRQELEIKRGV